MELRNKTAVLTGASGGIGSAIAERLAGAGARLILVGRNREGLQRQAERLSRRHGLPADRKPLPLDADIGTPEGRQSMAETCRREGIDILINNAGSQLFGLFVDQDEADIAALLALNLVAPLLLTRKLLPLLEARSEAAIVNIGSTFGSIGHPAFATYCASKAGLGGFSEALRRELAGGPVRVHHLAPRATRTALNDDRVSALNEALGNGVDEPSTVADALLELLASPRGRTRHLGWPESLFVRINKLFPAIVDRALGRQLALIRRHARDH